MNKLIILIFLFTALTGFRCFNENEESDSSIVDYLKQKSLPLEKSAHLTPLIKQAGDRRLALLGEATHGTSEFYTWRAEISKRLVKEKGFSFIVVEGDWGNCFRLNQYVKGLPGAAGSAREIMLGFSRWPLWMWANEETLELVEWLRKHNEKLPPEKRVGFYGMDVYDHWASKEAVKSFFKEHFPKKYPEVENSYSCLKIWYPNLWNYAHDVARGGRDCVQEVQKPLTILREQLSTLKDESPLTFFDAEQHALVVRHAEQHFRTGVHGGSDSWNIRARHMHKTVMRLLEFYGEQSKGIVWAHNTHIGDAHATPMAQLGMVNIGRMTREQLGEENVFLLGFGMHRGTVKAGRQWEAPMEEMNIPPGMAGSLEALMNQAGKPSFLLLPDEKDKQAEWWRNPIGHRVIGVTYNPEQDAGNYVPTLFTLRYDGFIFIAETKALKPLHP